MHFKFGLIIPLIINYLISNCTLCAALTPHLGTQHLARGFYLVSHHTLQNRFDGLLLDPSPAFHSIAVKVKTAQHKEHALLIAVFP